jgi:hypothetical protein
VAFSMGSRACLGVRLIWAELYLCLAGIFRWFGSKDVRGKNDNGILELSKTDVSDVEIAADMLSPVVKKGSKGARVKISN